MQCTLVLEGIWRGNGETRTEMEGETRQNGRESAREKRNSLTFSVES